MLYTAVMRPQRLLLMCELLGVAMQQNSGWHAAQLGKQVP
jgi:hypothetical protein